MRKIEVADPGFHTAAGLLAGAGHQARLVGGAVRDILSGSRPKDFDVATDALPERVMEIAAAAGVRTVATGLKHGTVTLVVGGLPYEVTTLRVDVDTDGRHAEVAFVDDFRLDAARRDFTFNAMSASPDGSLFDYFGGVSDLAARRVRFVGSAADRMREDYLRVLRFFRFRARFGGGEPADDLSEVSAAAPGLSGISAERIWSEISRMSSHPDGAAQLQAMHDLGVDRHAGMPWREGAGRLAAAAISSGAPAAAVMGLISGSPDSARALAERWRMSRSEEEAAVRAAQVACDPEGSPRHWLGIASDGVPAGLLVPALAATGRHEAAAALAQGVPSFPLRGRDLVEAGHEPGPGLGEVLSRARHEWKESGFALGADDLIAMFPPASGRKP